MIMGAQFAVLLGAASLGLWSLSGCGSVKYQMVKEPVAPEMTAAKSVIAGGVEFELLAVIVYEGPGSWKRKAYWDEYVVRVNNKGGDPVTLSGALLGDVLDREVRPGSDPWALEKAGHKHEAHLQNCGAPALVELSAMDRKKRTVAMTGSTVAVAGVLLAMPAAIYAAGAAGLVATPVAITNWAFINPKLKQQVMDEFKRRNLELPRELAPGASVIGSLFFPLTPGPEFLSVTARSGTADITLKIPMPELEELHFTYVPDKEALKAAKPMLALLGLRPRVPEKKTAQRQ